MSKTPVFWLFAPVMSINFGIHCNQLSQGLVSIMGDEIFERISFRSHGVLREISQSQTCYVSTSFLPPDAHGRSLEDFGVDDNEMVSRRTGVNISTMCWIKIIPLRKGCCHFWIRAQSLRRVHSLRIRIRLRYLHTFNRENLGLPVLLELCGVLLFRIPILLEHQISKVITIKLLDINRHEELEIRGLQKMLLTSCCASLNKPLVN